MRRMESFGRKYAVIVFISVLLTACGGGDSISSDAPSADGTSSYRDDKHKSDWKVGKPGDEYHKPHHWHGSKPYPQPDPDPDPQPDPDPDPQPDPDPDPQPDPDPDPQPDPDPDPQPDPDPDPDPVPGTSNIDLTWSAPGTRTDGSPLALSEIGGYKVYMGTVSGVYSPAIDVGNTTSHTFSSMPAGTYYFAISTYDTNGLESAKTAEFSATVQ